MLSIENIMTYRDGGTVEIKCRMAVSWKEVAWLEHRRNQVVTICLDRRFGKEPKMWFGYPEADGSEPIEDQSIIDYIISKLESYKAQQAHRLDQFINYKENVREWRIDQALDQ